RAGDEGVSVRRCAVADGGAGARRAAVEEAHAVRPYRHGRRYPAWAQVFGMGAGIGRGAQRAPISQPVGDALRHRIAAVPVAVELDQRVSRAARRLLLRRPLGAEEPRELVEDEVEVALGVLDAEALEGGAVDRVLRHAAIGELD